MEANHYEELKSYILYREDRARKRAARERLCAQLPSVPALPGVLASVQKEFPGEEYELPTSAPSSSRSPSPTLPTASCWPCW